MSEPHVNLGRLAHCPCCGRRGPFAIGPGWRLHVHGPRHGCDGPSADYILRTILRLPPVDTHGERSEGSLSPHGEHTQGLSEPDPYLRREGRDNR